MPANMINANQMQVCSTLLDVVQDLGRSQMHWPSALAPHANEGVL